MRPTSGKVLASGTELSTLSTRELRAHRARIGFVHQDHSLVPNLRVSQNVISGKLGQLGFFGALRAMVRPNQADLEHALELLEAVGIGDKLFERTDRLSGGQQQRVAIARALFQEPSALLADEPVASVDPARARDLMKLLVRLASERGLPLIVSLHDIEIAREFFPRTIGLRNGQLVFDCPTASLTTADFSELYRLENKAHLRAR
ncbi:MAG: phosphonate transport system ATP-binding protein [Planctomycetota bacterium]